MKLFLQIHIVKKGETLEQIANLYHIPSIEILKYHHYQNTPKDSNHLVHTLSPGQEIFIPDAEDIEEIIWVKKQAFQERQQHSHSLITNGLLLPNFFNLNQTYTVKITDTNDLKPEKETITEFQFHIQYLGKEEELSIFRVNKKAILVNGKLPEMKAYELALHCSASLFPVELGINSDGEISSIHNYRHIANNWQQNKQQLLQLYVDKKSLLYINDTAATIENRDLLQEIFSREICLQFFFSPYFKIYSQGKNETKNRFSEYRILYNNIYEISINEEILVTQSSIAIDPRSQQEIRAHIKNSHGEHENKETLASEISAHFYFDKQNKILQKADAKIETFLYNTQETKHIQIDKK